ncbi:MAG: helix-turn-helix domain-containing protein, partial [Acidimicrobiales bacterium]|nr:helix-turn-helix domain-containing protein [Acidimicrobiales bacterium]
QAFERGLAVIKAFDADHPELTLSDVARLTGINRAAARRFVLTLEALGYIRAEGRYFSLTPKVLELGFAYLSTLSLPDVATPHLRTLAATVGESSYLSLLEKDEIVCIATIPVRRIWSASLTVGTRLPALSTAAGRVLLSDQDDGQLDEHLANSSLRSFTSYTITDRDSLRSELRTIRRQGWALVDQELEDGIRTLAAPVHDCQGAVIAAVSISKLIGRCDTSSARQTLLPPLLAAAEAIDIDLRRARSQGGRGPGGERAGVSSEPG